MDGKKRFFVNVFIIVIKLGKKLREKPLLWDISFFYRNYLEQYSILPITRTSRDWWKWFELSGVNYEEVLEQGDTILVRVIGGSSFWGYTVYIFHMRHFLLTTHHYFLACIFFTTPHIFFFTPHFFPHSAFFSSQCILFLTVHFVSHSAFCFSPRILFLTAHFVSHRAFCFSPHICLLIMHFFLRHTFFLEIRLWLPWDDSCWEHD